SITGLIFKIITEEPIPIEEADPETPPEMVRIIRRALNKAPEVRYQSGRELADDLMTLTRAGAAPTLRQADVDTARGASAVSAPTFAGGMQTIASAATAAARLPARVAGRSGRPGARPPAA